MFTPLHRELGLGPTEALTFEMLKQAVEDGVLEQEDLDWKAGFSDSPGWADEFAKDVAAMANGIGGMLVLGVREVTKTSAARELHDVGEIDQEKEKKLRRVAFTAVRPAITNLAFERLDSADGTVHALAVRVPASVDAPHLVMRNQQAFGVPMRVGRDTEWMQEWQIERAYRARFRGQEDRAAILDTLWDQEAQTVRLRHQAAVSDVWMVLTAMPVDPVPAGLGQVTADDASRILFVGFRLGERIISGSNGSVIRNFPVRPGRRRWQTYDDGWGTADYYTAVGHDGSVVYAKRVGTWSDYDEDSLTVMTREELERAVAFAVGTVAESGRRLSIPTRFRVKTGVVWWPSGTALIMAREDQFGKVRLIRPLIPVHAVHPEITEIDTAGTNAELRESMKEIVVLLASQGGLEGVTFLDRAD
jgi:hypothetical protein